MKRGVRSARRQHVPNYKPVPLKGPFLAVLLLYVLILLALLEYARRVLPAVGLNGPRADRYTAISEMPVTTVESGFNAAKLAAREPRPPDNEYLTTTLVPTGRWGFSFVDYYTHGPGMATQTVKSPTNPFTLGRCVMGILAMGPSENPEDCLATYPGSGSMVWLDGPPYMDPNGTMVWTQPTWVATYEVRLLSRDCRGFFEQFVETYSFNLVQNITYAPACWSEEAASKTIFEHMSDSPPIKLITTREQVMHCNCIKLHVDRSVHYCCTRFRCDGGFCCCSVDIGAFSANIHINTKLGVDTRLGNISLFIIAIIHVRFGADGIILNSIAPPIVVIITNTSHIYANNSHNLAFHNGAALGIQIPGVEFGSVAIPVIRVNNHRPRVNIIIVSHLRLSFAFIDIAGRIKFRFAITQPHIDISIRYGININFDVGGTNVHNILHLHNSGS
ncbi:hypothetical protein B0H63DRAFT_508689 [Podospora didyma]|uniref:Uncharacterized protein n=1 Tax=Podospora didyma TaxID=330526 RepID=A0AAE0NS73_9PEZI|nr:hypothetical protein B0H63DRAFT_508689 [Podospora didyma]